MSVHPVLETVGWSVLGGDVLDVEAPGARASAETTIVNMKLGARVNLVPHCHDGGVRSLYVGYGKALTDDRWYDHTLRAEYRVAF